MDVSPIKEWCDRLAYAKEQRKKFEAMEQEALEEILAFTGDDFTGVGEVNGVAVFERKERADNRPDIKLLKERYPEIYQEVLVSKTVRTLHPKG